jgi:hypothetical protein
MPFAVEYGSYDTDERGLSDLHCHQAGGGLTRVKDALARLIDDSRTSPGTARTDITHVDLPSAPPVGRGKMQAGRGLILAGAGGRVEETSGKL